VWNPSDSSKNWWVSPSGIPQKLPQILPARKQGTRSTQVVAEPWPRKFLDQFVEDLTVTWKDQKVIHGGFPEWWYPTTMGFPTKIIILGYICRNKRKLDYPNNIPIGSMYGTLSYMKTIKKSTIHVGKYATVPWILWDRDYTKSIFGIRINNLFPNVHFTRIL